MLKIRLSQRWFADGRLYRKGDHEVADHWEDKLPPGTEILGKVEPPPAVKKVDKGQKALDL